MNGLMNAPAGLICMRAYVCMYVCMYELSYERISWAYIYAYVCMCVCMYIVYGFMNAILGYMYVYVCMYTWNSGYVLGV
jgi:hypothetical protein